MTRPPQRLSRLLTYRLSRLAARAHAHHRFAHHPLCAAYAPEVLRIGRRTHVCAGCTWAAAGCVLGLFSGAASPRAWATPSASLGAQALGLLCLWALLRRHAQAYKWLVRAGPMLLLGWGAMQTVRGLWALRANAWLLVAQSALGLFGGLALCLYRRRRPWREPCQSCPQRHAAICDGWRRVVQRERALHRASSLLVERHAQALSQRR